MTKLPSLLIQALLQTTNLSRCLTSIRYFPISGEIAQIDIVKGIEVKVIEGHPGSGKTVALLYAGKWLAERPGLVLYM